MSSTISTPSSYDHDGEEGTPEIPQVNDGTKEWNEVEITFTWGRERRDRFRFRDRELSSRDR